MKVLKFFKMSLRIPYFIIYLFKKFKIYELAKKIYRNYFLYSGILKNDIESIIFFRSNNIKHGLFLDVGCFKGSKIDQFLNINKKLQINSACAISDSGTITEESSILNFPAVTIRNSHERPEGMDEGTVVMCGLESTKVIDAIKLVMKQYFKNTNITRIVKDYDIDNVSAKVLRIIYSYTDYVNKKVWFKS